MRIYIRWLLIGLTLGLSVNIFAIEGTASGRYRSIYVVPPPGPVVIDGKLDDWDLSGQIEVITSKDKVVREIYNARIVMMYDQEALYVGGIVRDPTPLSNEHDPTVDPEWAWVGDTLQLRICIDPSLGYPLTNLMGKDVSQIVHPTLWYDSKHKKPCLHLLQGMDLHNFPGYAKGVAPDDKFQAAYRFSDDKKGFSFEYRIPWATLGARNPPKSGDIVAATLQLHWDYQSPGSVYPIVVSRELQAEAGYGFQGTDSWGKAIFSSKGNIPKELTKLDESVEAPLPLNFTYDLPKDGDVTIALMDNSGRMVRHVLIQESAKAGKVTKQWDGLDDLGRPLAAGDYTWKGIYHNSITTKYLMGVHNSGQPSYFTEDGTGAWGGEHGSPSAALAVGDEMLLGWDGCEVGKGVIRTDLQGRKKTGFIFTVEQIASDGERFFSSGGSTYTDTSRVTVRAVSDGRLLTFADGASQAEMPPGGDKASNVVGGLAYGKGILYVSYPKRNIIILIDAEKGTIKETWQIPNPTRMVVCADGSLAVISEGKVVFLTLTQALSPQGRGISDHLDEPVSIAVDAQRNLYVANRGKLQNVSVFSPEGKYLRSIGKKGGRPVIGRYEKNGMLKPNGIAVDKEGKLWVPETDVSPKRISVWDTRTGKLVNEFFGPGEYAAFVGMDPEREDEAYCSGAIWGIDLDKGTWYPKSTFWRATTPASPPQTGVWMAEGVRALTVKGVQYAWSASYLTPTMIMKRDGDLFKPFAMIFSSNGYGEPNPLPAILKTNQFNPPGIYAWQDANDDQQVQMDEVTGYNAPDPRFAIWLDEDLNFWTHTGVVFRPVKFRPNDEPVYDFTKPEKLPAAIHADVWGPAPSLFVNRKGNEIYTIVNTPQFKDISQHGLARWDLTGKCLWNFGSATAIDWWHSLNKPIAKPGEMYGLVQPLGVAGDFTGAGSYFGVFHILTRDGLYVSRIFRDPREGKSGSDVLFTENFCGQMIKTEKNGRYLLLGGDTDGRITEILGLDSVKRFQGKYALSPGEAAIAKKALEEYTITSGKTMLDIVRGKEGFRAAKGISRTVDQARGFSAKVAYDAKNLYLAYDVHSPNELVNTVPDYKLIFKGGNLLDIQIAADDNVRILISRQKDAHSAGSGQGKPVAVIFRPKVKGFTGEPTMLTSLVDREPFDQIEPTDKIGLEYQKKEGGFTALVTVPLNVLGLQLKPETTVRMDLGYIFGNENGTQTSQRAYWSNHSPLSGVINDIPSESRLEPGQWGTAVVE